MGRVGSSTHFRNSSPAAPSTPSASLRRRSSRITETTSPFPPRRRHPLAYAVPFNSSSSLKPTNLGTRRLYLKSNSLHPLYIWYFSPLLLLPLPLLFAAVFCAPSLRTAKSSLGC